MASPRVRRRRSAAPRSSSALCHHCCRRKSDRVATEAEKYEVRDQLGGGTQESQPAGRRVGWSPIRDSPPIPCIPASTRSRKVLPFGYQGLRTISPVLSASGQIPEKEAS